MKYYFTIDVNSRLEYISSTKNPLVEEIEVELDETHEAVGNPFIFKYENGELIKDTAYQDELIEAEKNRENQPTKIQEIEKAQSDLVFTLMMNGVI